MTKSIQKIITLYLSREASVDDLDALSKWIKNPINNKEFIEYIKVNYAIDFHMKDFGTENPKKKLLEYIEKDRRALKRKEVFGFIKYAAIVILLVGIGIVYKLGYFDNLISGNVIPEISNGVWKESTIHAGTERAVLTTNDGKLIELGEGKTVESEKFKSNGEELVYDASKSDIANVVYNYLTIPRGGQFKITLSDGTRVWLNSESRLKYPVEFITGNTRTVELLYGEAYFEVSHSTEHDGDLFSVINQSQEVKVLGTEFNIKAYQEESNIYTTLVEGEIELDYGGETQILKPNQQARVQNGLLGINLVDVDVSEIVSWKNGLFTFSEETLEDMMATLSRWYDTEVFFENNNHRNFVFTGIMRRTDSIEEIIKIIERAGDGQIKFKITNNAIIVK